MATSKEERRAELTAVYRQARTCTRCPQLASTRTQVVFGAGNANADLMFVGEAPGAREDEQGVPFVGAAGKLLGELLAEVGLTREDVFIANALKCLRYNAMVQLGDGMWERIGRLVRSRYAGSVMSVDEQGQLVPKRVVGWHASAVGSRPVYRLTYRSSERAGRGRVGVELTGDHPVLTERGFVPVAELRASDRIATGQGLSSLAFDVACGSLLGDSSIPRRSAILTSSHAERQDEYAWFKSSLLDELRPVASTTLIAAVAGGPRAIPIVQTRTRAHRSLNVLRREFYRDRKVVPDWIAHKLNPRMLAFWFMDDGHTRQPPPRQPSSEIATNGFSDADRSIVLQGLLRLGLRAKAVRGRLHFDVDATRRLSTIIAPFVPATMRYKLHPEVADAIAFEPSGLTPGNRMVLYDEVEVEDISDVKRADTTFFCIDVADTHNFVTSGGVVHNCRPPGNRDPLPAEIENCSDYLLRQVELIQPRVICTLGNFSTKLLRGESTGISKLHGQAEIRVIGERAVRLYPLFHPAAALYTRSLLETLRADFARLPGLLELAPPVQPQRAPEPETEPEPAIPDPEPAAVPQPAAPEPAPVLQPAPEPSELDERQLGLF